MPDTSNTWRAVHCPTSIGRYCNLLSLKDSTPNCFKFPEKKVFLIKKNLFFEIEYFYLFEIEYFLPVSVGSDCKLFLSTFKLFRLRSFPIDIGSSKRKFSVRINSCKFSHL